MKNMFEDKFKVKGEYTAFMLDGSVNKNSNVLKQLRKYIKNGDKKIIEKLKKLNVLREVSFVTNLIPITGRNVLARLLTGDTTYTGEIEYGALGTGVSPAFTNASTQLDDEQYRKIATSKSYDDNIVYLDWFISSGDVADDTYTEFGAFIDGTSAADSGQAWSLLATGGWVKSGSLFISGKYTLI